MSNALKNALYQNIVWLIESMAIGYDLTFSTPIAMDWEKRMMVGGLDIMEYSGNVVKRFFSILKGGFEGLAKRYERLASDFLALA